MKKINELTEQEILALTEEQINTMIRFEAAEQGIKLLTFPTTPIYKEVPTPSKKAYYLGYFNSIAFLDIAIAGQIQEIIKSSESFGLSYPNGNYDLQYIDRGKTSGLDIKTVEVYEKSEIDSILVDTKENKKLKEDYEERVSEYRENQKKIDEISKEIYDVVYSIRDKYETLSRYCGLYKNDYLTLANNNKDIAMNFLVKAYALTEEQQKYVAENSKTK